MAKEWLNSTFRDILNWSHFWHATNRLKPKKWFLKTMCDICDRPILFDSLWRWWSLHWYKYLANLVYINRTCTAVCKQCINSREIIALLTFFFKKQIIPQLSIINSFYLGKSYIWYICISQAIVSMPTPNLKWLAYTYSEREGAPIALQRESRRVHLCLGNPL